jgi:CRP-like cAMP-binding protein
MKSALTDHPAHHTIRLQLRRHPLFAEVDEPAFAALVQALVIQDGHRGECLLAQGDRDWRQFFVLEGLLKRVVTSPEGREVALRFTGEGDMETCYEAWRQQARAPFSVVCAARSRVAMLPMADWCGWLAQHPRAHQAYHERVVQLGADIVDHAVGLLLFDAPGRMQRFSCAHPELVERLPQKDLASHLNLSAETLCRLSRRGKAVTASAALQGTRPFSGAA